MARLRRLPDDIEVDTDEAGGIDSPFDNVFDSRSGKPRRVPYPPTEAGDLAEPPPSREMQTPDPVEGMFSGFGGGPLGQPPDPERSMVGMLGDDELFSAVLQGVQSGKKKMPGMMKRRL